MGNYRFRLSDMLPNAWFYKLNHTSTNKTRKLQNLTHKSSNKKVQSKTKSSPFSSSSSTAAAPQQTCHLRRSCHFNPDFKLASLSSEPPRKSSNIMTRSTKKTKAFRKLVANSSVSSEYSSCHVSRGSIYSQPSHMSELAQNYSTGSSSCDDPVFHDLDSEFKRVKVDSPSNLYDYRVESNSSISNHNYERVENSDKFDLLPQLELKPILTKLDKGDHGMKPAMKFQGSSMKFEEESSCSIKDDKCPGRKLRVNSGVKLRAKSPRIAPKRLTQVQGRGSVSSHSRLMSVAIVKESTDPDKDFKESMMEMIIEHNMSTKEELEQLLACYLSLNPGTYHELIAKVFQQIWFEITGN